jgi:hypothetical protein
LGKHDYSQLPVMTSERDVKGVISWNSIGTRLCNGGQPKSVREAMDSAIEAQDDVSLFAAIPIVVKFDYLLVRASDRRPLSIETKTSSVGASGTLHLTRNEWERALDFELHSFHLWDVSIRDSPKLAVISPNQMRPHIPIDAGSGEWEAVEIPFDAFEASFVSADVGTESAP